jgi:aspartate racemase
LISIVDATCADVERRGMTKVGLLGTRFTMQAHFYQDVFSRKGIRLVVPREDEQDYIHDKYISELLVGVFLPATRQRLLGIIERMKQQDQIQAAILAGTELPLILTEEQACGTPLLDTTKIHVQAVVERLLSEL